MTGPTVTIEEVTDKLNTWRKERTHRAVPMPQHLKDLVRQLIPHYPVSTILKHTRIACTLFYALKRSSNNNFKEPPTPQDTQHILDFVPFSIPQHHTISTCTITKNNGTQLTFQTPDLHLVINSFLCSS